MEKKHHNYPSDSAVSFSARQLQNDFLTSLFWFYGAEPFFFVLLRSHCADCCSFQAQQVVRVRGGEGNDYKIKKKRSHISHV